ncbi:gluconate 2-dehydrogenase subunit 3 family protein [Flavivirga rizhaonensis]|uniref:Gluconate 2-dehydrogenase subunit 3 family protein n=1 Tax=Flavivirga rizhaonensis TaxID=2559571 RepID=A0A4S1DYX2_9FLAO|nr:gluconate 2-dehydrogenase subunit 3 family protein [Flavivirga rizhaonensis]TGV03511.1 gluconate 2-dehydrogenase subunit 3 family protein [Flavivirga rizhaonensis]
MNRREVLKGLGLTLGYTIATPSIMSLLQSCNTEVKLWIPKLLSVDEGIVLKNLIDIMLPKTEITPGALDVNVPEFIDLYVYEVYEDDMQYKFKKGISTIIKALNIPEEGVSLLEHKDYDALLTKYLKVSKKQRLIYENENDKKNEDATIFNALIDLRNTSVWVYKTSQQIGEHVLAYDPIPGTQIGCVSLEESTGGKAWSL